MGKKAKKVKAPDYKALAEQQAKLNQEAMDRQTRDNRINQVTATGGSLTYETDPTTGMVTQREQFSPEQQALYDQQVARQQQLSGATDASFQNLVDQWGNPLDKSGMQGVRGIDESALTQGGQAVDGIDSSQYQHLDPSKFGEYGNLDYGSLGDMPEAGFGAVEGIRDAMMSRLQPQMDQARQREQQRLAAMGFSVTDQGYNSVMDQRNRADNDARSQALLAGAQEYGNIFNRGMDVRRQGAGELFNKAQFDSQNVTRKIGDQRSVAGFENELLGTDMQNQMRAGEYAENLRRSQLNEQAGLRDIDVAERQRQIAEAERDRARPWDEYKAISGQMTPVNPEFESYNRAGLAGAADIQGAEQKAYEAKVAKANADAARKAGIAGGVLKLAGTAVGGMFGMPQVGAAIGGMLSPKAGSNTAYSNPYSSTGVGLSSSGFDQ
jgi:hypothetical protein